MGIGEAAAESGEGRGGSGLGENGGGVECRGEIERTHLRLGLFELKRLELGGGIEVGMD